MRKLFFIMLLIVSVPTFSQEQITVVKDTADGKRDGLVLSNGKVIWEGEQIKCGRGTLPNGDFKYIHTSPSSWLNMATVSHANPLGESYRSIGRSYSGLNLDVKKVQRMGNKKRGFKYYLKVGGGNIANYLCEIEDALAVGEIVF